MITNSLSHMFLGSLSLLVGFTDSVSFFPLPSVYLFASSRRVRSVGAAFIDLLREEGLFRMDVYTSLSVQFQSHMNLGREESLIAEDQSYSDEKKAFVHSLPSPGGSPILSSTHDIRLTIPFLSFLAHLRVAGIVGEG